MSPRWSIGGLSSLPFLPLALVFRLRCTHSLLNHLLQRRGIVGIPQQRHDEKADTLKVDPKLLKRLVELPQFLLLGLLRAPQRLPRRLYLFPGELLPT